MKLTTIVKQGIQIRTLKRRIRILEAHYVNLKGRYQTQRSIAYDQGSEIERLKEELKESHRIRVNQASQLMHHEIKEHIRERTTYREKEEQIHVDENKD